MDLLSDLFSPVILASCRALGLIGFLVITPLLNLFKSTTSAYLNVGARIPEVVSALETWTHDSERFVHADLPSLLPEFPPDRESPIFQKLIAPPSDDTTQLIHKLSIDIVQR